MKNYIAAVTFVGLAGAAFSPLACGSKASTFPEDDGGGGSPAADGSTSSSGGSSSGSSSGGGSSGASSGGFTQGDSGGMGTGVCKTGTYSGSFSCGFIYDADAAAIPIGDGGTDGGVLLTITGNLSFVLTQSMSGELGTDTASGMFVLNAGLTTGMATLSGTLDCSTGLFTGQLSGGTYSVFFGLFTGPFAGPLTSDYNGTSSSFVDGVWSLTVPGEGYCPGQWTADFADAGP